MKVAVCLDDRAGMMFGSKRQSMDSKQRKIMLAHMSGAKVWMNEYTAKLFDPLPGNAVVAEDFLDRAEEDDWCFVENKDLTPYLNRITELLIYRWNRTYPATLYFPENKLPQRLRLVGKMEFPGSSHEKITQEVYKL